MQSWILDYDIDKSASYLDRNRLQANIYENIHGLASLLGVNDNLVNPKRSVKNHPNIKRWEKYKKEYLCYIGLHLDNWIMKGYKTIINLYNFNFLKDFFCFEKYLTIYECQKIIDNNKPDFINDDLIKKHQQVLLKKDYEHYSKYFIKD